MPSSTRSLRVEARIAPEALAIVKRAAELQGRSVSDFLVAAAHDAAHRAIEDAQIVRLALDDQRAFADAVLDPPMPNAVLMRAAATHRSAIKARR